MCDFNKIMRNKTYRGVQKGTIVGRNAVNLKLMSKEGRKFAIGKKIEIGDYSTVYECENMPNKAIKVENIGMRSINKVLNLIAR